MFGTGDFCVMGCLSAAYPAGMLFDWNDGSNRSLSAAYPAGMETGEPITESVLLSAAYPAGMPRFSIKRKRIERVAG
ncbi:hypothetical protein SAMN05421853_12312 [Roseivivax halotolerans]|uniref:Uncharacterized protein n=1 Tax=Roseivivax halotolerans TaxID=93684 RepID=A0A1I6AKC9_9RHOB|nr:hypothetical protein SAMN05421853_12312 [Roseivivax halotolerans]